VIAAGVALLGAVLLGAILLGIAGRWRGSGRSYGLGRPACALLIAVPALLANWQLGLAVFGLSWLGVAQDHDPSGRDWQQNVSSGLLFTGYAALAEASQHDWRLAAAFALAGLAKGAWYLLPAGTWSTGPLQGRFVWRELGFFATCGAVAGWAAWDAWSAGA